MLKEPSRKRTPSARMKSSMHRPKPPTARKAVEAAHGRPLRTTAGRVVQIEGAPAPKSVAMVEWDSVDDAVAFYKSKTWADLAPERDKAVKVIRRYVVEVEK